MHQAQQHHADITTMSMVLAITPASVLWHFVALGFVSNGVIATVNSPRQQADDDADNQSGDNQR